MPDEDRISTLNAPGEPDGGAASPNSGDTDGGSSSIPEAPSTDPDFVNTVGVGTEPEGANNTGDQEKDAGGDEEGGEKKGTEDKGESDEERFDKHPAWQRIKKQRDEANERAARLEQKVDELTSAVLSKKDEKGGERPPSLLDKEEDELREMMDDDPKGFLKAILDEGRNSALSEFQEQSRTQGYQAAVIDTIDQFASEHPDFDQMWDRKEIQSFIDNHPGHNAISAYWALKSDGLMSKEDHEKAVQDAIEKDRANRSSKRLASVQGAGASGSRAVSAHSESPELKNPSKFGGSTSALVHRLRAKRAEQAGA
jgi:hypothetical protein